MSYFFYDIETTGLNKAFDQVMQFAAIRTDEDLNEIERHELLVKINPDVIPSPYALITHHIPVEKANTGLCEYEAIRKIHDWMNQSKTISLGYNTLGFDDEFLRFSFYRNLLPPYTHQYANQCGRMDLYPIAALYYLFQPEALQWPIVEGKPSLKLEYLNAKNNLAVGMAHDAMVDVEATVELAKRLMQHDKMWDYCRGYFNKEEDLSRAAKLPEAFLNYKIGLIIDGSFGFKNNYQCPVLSLGAHYHYKNQTLWLRLDDEKLSTTSSKTINEIPWVIRKKIGENNLLLPFIDRFTQHIDKDRQKIIDENLNFLKKNPKLLQEISEYHRNYTYPFIPDLDVDAALYQNGFPTPYEQQLSMQFHQKPIIEKHEVIDKFLNKNLREQAIRILARNYPDHLPEKYRAEFDAYMEIINSDKPLTDYRGKNRMTKKEAAFQFEHIGNKDKS